MQKASDTVQPTTDIDRFRDGEPELHQSCCGPAAGQAKIESITVAAEVISSAI
jgi:hypothetical protein